MKVVLVMLVVTAVLLIYQTTSPVRITESMIFSYKHKMLLGEAETVASSLSSSQNLTSQGAEEIMSVLGTRDMGQVVITDGDGVVLYSSNLSVSPVGSCTLYPEIVSALRGNDAFRCSFTGDAFVSRGAIPVMFGGDTIGCVYMVEIDSEQAELLTSIQNNAVRTSIITVLVSLILYVVFGLVVIRKNESLLQSIRRVQDGDYEHRVEVKGKDEFAVLANEFNALTDRLQQTEQIRRQFVSDASHELRTPLAAMRLLSDSILQNDMDADTMREFVSDIGNESDRLTRMTQKLLTLSKADAETVCDHEVVDLSEIVRRVFRMLVPLADKTEVRLTANLDRGCFVLSMEDDAYQIIFNLVENGIKYNHSGGCVHVTVSHTQEDVELLVEDTGMGIPQAAIEHIFERFYRVDKARSRQAGGSGLGLSIVHELVERNFGSIAVSSEEGKGTRFTVRLPYFALEEDEDDA